MKYALATSAAPRVGSVWLTRALATNTPLDARITLNRANLQGDEFMAQWMNGARDFYMDVGSELSALLPVMRMFDPKTVLLVRNPYYQLRSILSWQYFNEKKEQPIRGSRTSVIKYWLSRIYGGVELAATVFDALGLEWEPFGISQLSTEQGIRALADFIDLPLTKCELPGEQYMNRAEQYIDLDEWYPLSCALMFEFDKLYPRVLDILVQAGELLAEDRRVIAEGMRL